MKSTEERTAVALESLALFAGDLAVAVARLTAAAENCSDALKALTDHLDRQDSP